MFINVSNHPSDSWGEEQRQAALQKATLVDDHDDVIEEGRIVDIPFPAVPPTATEQDVSRMASDLVAKIRRHLRPEEERELWGDDVVMVQGEFTLCHAVVAELRAMRRVRVIAATSERRPDGGFTFVRFRRYVLAARSAGIWAS